MGMGFLIERGIKNEGEDLLKGRSEGKGKEGKTQG
jgi:hypothetical protein